MFPLTNNHFLILIVIIIFNFVYSPLEYNVEQRIQSLPIKKKMKRENLTLINFLILHACESLHISHWVHFSIQPISATVWNSSKIATVKNDKCFMVSASFSLSIMDTFSKVCILANVFSASIPPPQGTIFRFRIKCTASWYFISEQFLI